MPAAAEYRIESREDGYERQTEKGPLIPHLEITLNQRQFYLPMREVTKQPDPENQKWIAFFDPDPEHNPDLCEAGASELARLIPAETKLVLTPTSSKSIPMVERALQIATQELGHSTLHGIVLPGGSKYDDVKRQVTDESKIIRYVPITRDEDHPKFIGVTQEQEELIRELCPDGEGLAVMDDVMSTGNTLNAIDDLLEKIYGKSLDEYPIITVACEIPYGNYPPSTPNVYFATTIPVFTGPLPMVS